MSAAVPASAPPATKVQRLLLWLPQSQIVPAPPTVIPPPSPLPPDVLFDSSAFSAALTEKLSAFGVPVQAATASSLELDRRDAQRTLLVQFRPTHRFEVDVVSGMMVSSGFGVRREATITLRGSLYPSDGNQPVRVFAFKLERGGRESAMADYVVQRLQTDGFL